MDRGLGLGVYARAARRHLRGARVGVDVPARASPSRCTPSSSARVSAADDYEVVALGSTPKRLEALLAGECDATMLGAGNDLRAEEAGLPRLGRVSRRGPPYLGTVAGGGRRRPGGAADGGRSRGCATRPTIVAGRLDGRGSPPRPPARSGCAPLAERYVSRIKDPAEGLVADGAVDPASIRTVVDLRRRYLPETDGGIDVFAAALAAGSGLLVAS